MKLILIGHFDLYNMDMIVDFDPDCIATNTSIELDINEMLVVDVMDFLTELGIEHHNILWDGVNLTVDV